MDERDARKALGQLNSAQEDNHIANLIQTPGWEVLEAKAQSMIIELLEPVEFSDETPLDVRGAIGEARKFGIEVLRKLLNEVSSVKAAKIAEKANKQENPESADPGVSA